MYRPTSHKSERAKLKYESNTTIISVQFYRKFAIYKWMYEVLKEYLRPVKMSISCQQKRAVQAALLCSSITNIFYCRRKAAAVFRKVHGSFAVFVAYSRIPAVLCCYRIECSL